jgi:serine/threonine-protein kinase
MTATDDLDTWHAAPPCDDRAHCPRCGGSYPGGYRACPYDATPLVVGDDPLIDRVIADRYRIERLAGEGGVGRVYVAKHIRIDRRYALKVPSGNLVSMPRGRERFTREALAASRLDHPNVVSVLDFGETDAGLPYIVMELADGETLAAMLKRRGRLPLAEALSLMRQIASGLDHAHGRGLIHRDLKPTNVMIERADGRPRILDFGLAIALASSASDRLTSAGTVVGTPHFMSPEQLCGLELDPRTDLFSLGIIFYLAIAGCLPFDGTPVEVVQKYLERPIPRFGTRVPGLIVDRDVEGLCMRMASAHRDRRPASAHDVIAALDAILGRIARAS